ncbi:hypothetical protein CHH28_04460 [Bacterioplanes sanyensis]|uniref:Uncharacterized protein n=1 Tax=Bacterioplanes sanyensis TaxID=1249553 RepID=A0A222FFY1_9GAMM|nr:hypothetical protein [Bacterioplanes sanyensis]ASP37977.1 hypothetical protein CHH28_04460 [Bacterioplanes sanyensis]
MHKNSLLLVMLTATVGLTACGGGDSDSSSTESDTIDGTNESSNSGLTMTLERGDSHYLAVMQDDNEWLQLTGDSNVQLEVDENNKITYLFVCKHGESGYYTHMRTLYLSESSTSRLCQFNASADSGGFVSVQSADSTAVVELLVTDVLDINDNRSTSVVEEIELSSRSNPRSYLAIGKRDSRYYALRRDNVQLEDGDTLTLDFSAPDVEEVSTHITTEDIERYSLTYRTMDSVPRIRLNLNTHSSLRIPASMMREDDWYEEHYRFEDGSAFVRSTRTPASEPYNWYWLPDLNRDDITFSQDKLTATIPSLGQPPEPLPHGYASVSYDYKSGNDQYVFGQIIMLPNGYSGSVDVPLVDLTALPGFPEWAMFDYNSDNFGFNWQYGYRKPVSGSLETNKELLYRDSF